MSRTSVVQSLTTHPLRNIKSFLVPMKIPLTLGGSIRPLHILHKNLTTHPPPDSSSMATIYLLVLRSFSHYCLMHQTIPCHLRLRSTFSLETRSVPPLYCFATGAIPFNYSLLHSTTGIPLVSFWQAQISHSKSQFQFFR